MRFAKTLPAQRKPLISCMMTIPIKHEQAIASNSNEHSMGNCAMVSIFKPILLSMQFALSQFCAHFHWLLLNKFTAITIEWMTFSMRLCSRIWLAALSCVVCLSNKFKRCGFCFHFRLFFFIDSKLERFGSIYIRQGSDHINFDFTLKLIAAAVSLLLTYPYCNMASTAFSNVQLLHAWVFDIKWYKMPVKYQLYIKMMLIPAQNTRELSGYHVIDCSLETFRKVKTIFVSVHSERK